MKPLREPKAPAKLFKLKRKLAEYLERASVKENKTMTQIMEEMLEHRSSFKQWPPTAKQ